MIRMDKKMTTTSGMPSKPLRPQGHLRGQGHELSKLLQLLSATAVVAAMVTGVATKASSNVVEGEVDDPSLFLCP